MYVVSMNFGINYRPEVPHIPLREELKKIFTKYVYNLMTVVFCWTILQAVV